MFGIEMAFAGLTAPPRMPLRGVRPSSDGRVSPRHPPSSPRQFIQETLTPRHQRSSTLTPVDDENQVDCIGDGRQQQQSLAAQSQATPMSHPLFAGWADANLFESLICKDVARLHRRLAAIHRNQTDTPKGRRELLDPAACARSLSSMLLEPIANIVSGKTPSSARIGQPKRRSLASDPCEHLRSMCGQLAERAAQFEVLMALLAELMVSHLLRAATNTSNTALAQSSVLADSTACPWTRIGWVDEIMVALEASISVEAKPKEDVHRALPLCKNAAVQAVVPQAGKKTIDIQTTISSNAVATQTDLREVVLGSSSSEMQAIKHESCHTSVSCQTQLQVQDASVITDMFEQVCKELDAVRGVMLEKTCQTENQVTVSHMEIQASTLTVDVSAQAFVNMTEIETQTIQFAVVTAEVQTDPPPAPKPGGMREKKLNAEDANRQLENAREKLALEREAQSALEIKLTAANTSIANLRQEANNLRNSVAQHAAIAEAAALRPQVSDACIQFSPEMESTDAQTDGITFYSHSWQDRPTSRRSVTKPVDATTQTEAAQRKFAATQTPREKKHTLDACVGDEEPLNLILGASSLPPDGVSGGRWRDTYGQGMQALAEQWRSRCEAAEAERNRLAQIVAAGNNSGGG